MTDALRDARLIAVVGPHEADAATLAAAEEVGALLADAGACVVTGGLGGVMEAASRGAKSRRGTTIGVLPGTDADAANGWVDLRLATGLGELRDGVLVALSQAVVAVGGGHGTLLELGSALRLARPVAGLGTWVLPGVAAVETPRQAVDAVVAALG